MIGFRKTAGKYRICLLVFLLICNPAWLRAQSDRDAKSALNTEQLSELREKGSAALFNLDYEAARQTFKDMARLSPDDPIGPQMLAWTVWLETLNKSRLHQGAIYSSQSFTGDAEEKPDPNVVREFRDLIRQATQLARARLQRNARDPLALYTVGAIENLSALFALTVERRFLAGLRESSSGVERHREVIKLDPNFHDAELTIGMYDYIVGSLPLAVKLVASLAGARGSKKRGMQTLERVANEGHWERDNAKLVLMALYKYQKRFADSLALSRELQQKYPRNYLFKLETADTITWEAVAERQANRSPTADALEEEGLSMFESLLREHSAAGTAIRLDVVHFRYGEALLLLGQPASAAQQFHALTMMAGADAELVTRAHLRDAQSLDLAGKRTEALIEYRIVTTRPNTDDSLAQARRGLKEPYKRGK